MRGPLRHGAARRLRRGATFAEAAFWRMARGRNLAGLKFRWQVPIGPYVVDFACLKRRLAVELDGGVHGAAIYDSATADERDAWLRREGYRVLRFKNGEVEARPHVVMERILAEFRGG